MNLYYNGFDEWFETVKNKSIAHHNKEDLRISYGFGSIHESMRRDKQCKALEEENKKLKDQLAKAVEVVRYSESQFRYIYNVSNRVDVSECASYSSNKSRDFLDKIKEVEL